MGDKTPLRAEAPEFVPTTAGNRCSTFSSKNAIAAGSVAVGVDASSKIANAFSPCLLNAMSAAVYLAWKAMTRNIVRSVGPEYRLGILRQNIAPEY